MIAPGLPRAKRKLDFTFGQVLDTEFGWMIDAEPHVMIRARQIFKGATSVPNGQYTHSVLCVTKTQDNAKDITWLCDRYPLEIDDQAKNDIHRLADRHDRALIAARQGDYEQTLLLSDEAYEMAEPPRPYQVGAVNLWRKVRRLLVADGIGLGKTITGITGLCEPDARPALIVCEPHLCLQWQKQVKRFLPQASTYVIRGTKLQKLPKVDVLITSYTRLAAWQDILVPLGLKTVEFDEVQQLRHDDTAKRHAARAISEKAEYVLGLSATPIYNRGKEIWSVIDALNPFALGTQADFVREWCDGDNVRDPVALHAFLKSRGFMLRRMKIDVGMTKLEVTREVITLDGDLRELTVIEDVAKKLAMSVLRGVVGESEKASRELDWKLRQATGIAKAKPVAELVKMLCDAGEKVLLAGWHRDVYEIWNRVLHDYRPVMYTGTESPAQKNKAVEAFTEGNSQVFIISLRSGAGIDGLQHVCSNIVFGELDWSPHVMDQLIGRIDRDGQTKPVNAFFPVIDDGSDPFMIEVLGDKRSQHDGLVEGKQAKAEILADTGPRVDRIRAMAEAYLASIGEAIPNAAPAEGLQAEVAAALRRLKLPSNCEREMQDALWSVLPGLLPTAKVEREYRVGERSRLDFLVTRGNERIAIECKIDQTGRTAVYRQVRRYAEEAGITGAVILAPWSGVSSFIVEEVPVIIVDWAKGSLL